jgi:4-amino-4-deoxy-L-arabinose transferase-like glycosyltransferase
MTSRLHGGPLAYVPSSTTASEPGCPLGPSESGYRTRFRKFAVVLLLVIPSAAYLWHFGVLPRFGDLQDAGVYYVSAKSLAEGGGYRIESLPGEPAQTEKPPLYPLLLSVAWRIDPQFPRNLSIAAWISWLALPAMLLLSAAYFPKLGVSGWRAWLLLCLIASNPYVVFCSSQLLADLLFLALILLTMLLVERGVEGEGGIALAVIGGVVAGLTYLTRSAGIAILPAAVVYFGLRGRWRRGIWFTAAAAPFIAGWMLWSRLHHAHTADSVLMQYTDYLGVEIYTLRHVSVHKLLWKNLDGLVWGLGSLVQPRVFAHLMKILASALGAAMVAGVVRMVRRGHGVLYALLAGVSVLMLIVLYYPADEHLLLPLLPLALAGLLVEMEHLAGMVRVGLRHPDRSQRIVARALAAAATVVLVGSVALEMYLTLIHLPEVAREERLTSASRAAAYGWIAANVPARANFLTTGGDDPILFLYTGRHAILNVMPLTFWYQDEHGGMVDWVGNPVPFARAHGLKYLEFAGVTTSWNGLSDEDGAAAARAILENPDFTALYRSGPVTVYALPQ